MKAPRLFAALLAVSLTGPMLPQPLAAQTIGMVANRNTSSVTVFDADTDTVIGTVLVPIDPLSSFGDCSITRDRTLGFVTDFKGQIWVIDLTTSPPSLAAGTNPIPISNNGEDTVISADDRFLVVCDGGATQPISVVDIASRTEVSTISVEPDCNSLEVCPDGSILVTSIQSDVVRRLSIDGAGRLIETPPALNFEANNTFCAPDGGAAIAVGRGAEIRLFATDGLSWLQSRTISGRGISGAFNRAGDRAFVRTNGSAVDVFGYDSLASQLSAAPLFSIPIANTLTFFGIDQLALHPNDQKLYVTQTNSLNVYDASDGALIKAITTPGLRGSTGVCVVGETSFLAHAGPDQTIECTSPAGGLTVLAGGGFDPGGNPLTFHWSVPGSVELEDPFLPNPMAVFPIGVTEATLTVTNEFGELAVDRVRITVVDTTPPEVACTTDLPVLWPPEHQLVEVRVSIAATDACTAPGDLILLAVTVTSDEPDDADGNGDGETTGDTDGADGFSAPVNVTPAFTFNWATFSFEGSVYLRAERSATGDGRSYAIEAAVLDSHNNLATTGCVVVVPRDESP